jgi:predicted PurR-regulated permease PerM
MADADSPVPRSVPIVRAACVVVILWGLSAAQSVLIPIVVAAFLSILAYKPLKGLHARGVPTVLALLIVMGTAVLVLGGVALLLGNAIVDFVAALPGYAEVFQAKAERLYAWLDARGIDVDVLEQDAQSDYRKLVTLATSVLKDILSLLSDFALILLVMAFMLAEGAALPKKLARAFGPGDSASNPEATGRIMDQVYQYVSIKTWISALTGVLFGLATWLIGVDAPVLWGVLAFALNFVPNVGPVLSVVPPALLALVTLGPTEMGMVVVANLLVNQVLGNIVEPKVMGDRLGLSPLVVMLSLLMWGALWGPIGMVLSVPLTMIVKIVMENSVEWRPIAVLLGPADPGPPAS